MSMPCPECGHIKTKVYEISKARGDLKGINARLENLSK